jgi:hypothetical protein
MRLPVAQRSCVILMDVLGHPLDEISQVTGISFPAVKAALNRGRKRLREIANEPEDLSTPALAEPVRLLLAKYVDRFNARDKSDAQGLGLISGGVTENRARKPLAVFFPSLDCAAFCR